MGADSAGLDELYEALDALAGAEAELKRQRRALFPAVLARRKATSRVLAVWRAMKGHPSDPTRPLLDAIDRGSGRGVEPARDEGIVVVEERPDGSPDRPVDGHVAAPPQGWGAGTLRHGAELLLGAHPDREDLADLVVCKRQWCRALRYCPRGERRGSRCPVCKGRSHQAYLTVLTALETDPPRAGIDLVTSRPGSSPTANGHPELEPDRVMPPQPARGKKGRRP